MPEQETLLQIVNLKKHFPIVGGLLGRTAGVVKAVDGISFDIQRGETLGMVGESGCGKSTAGRAILHLHKPTGGQVFFEGNDLTQMNAEALRALRPKMQMIFQDPYATLNPRHSVKKIVGEPLIIHGLMKKGSPQLKERVAELLELVGMDPAYMRRFPHEFSGGQRQRIGIARALSLNPDFIVCDEPISALDVSIQAQVVNLMQDLQEKLGVAYLFIAHDLSMVKHISHRIVVMYLGKVMELAERNDLFDNPLHPYTQSLNSAVPVPNPKVERKRKRFILEGDPPSPANPPSGCVFHTRCPLTVEECIKVTPDFQEIYPGHFVACHLANQKGGSKIPERANPVMAGT
ncbi:MAG: ATP-binding cassette domain-containing protein [Ardenticatenaceae bacterium]|nr:ATP-binding cassette domain-containing protein [Ardenticatenaceae bacterium]MCB9444622.1 ATP-binding cassette domain-containing protein [Ardenticatenaceae bacterium]